MGRDDKRKAAKAAKRAAKKRAAKAKAQPNGNARTLTPALDDAVPLASASPAPSLLAEAVAEARALAIERDNGQSQYNAHFKQAQAQIESILKGAGVFEKVNTVEAAREQRRQTIEARRQAIVKRLAELDIVIRFLRPRQATTAPAAKVAEE